MNLTHAIQTKLPSKYQVSIHIGSTILDSLIITIEITDPYGNLITCDEHNIEDSDPIEQLIEAAINTAEKDYFEANR